ncbi:sigma-E factor negative regulatory protein [Herbaspirillum sp. YR522]|uniref:sigma-E factor negative regulatory protein n=1 Tax=Herbaspirillum sp. YR522 TaxID=1144342 RepID=UPI00026F5378|nr:negative regulator of sigma E activity [Herbaspirillum sp. YR522]
MTSERISALADGELSSDELTIALAALRASEDERDNWEVYHQIGEVLRSDDMDVALSPGFNARMSALLDAEPTIVSPQAVPEAAVPVPQATPANGDHRAAPSRLSRFFLPSAAAAAAAVAAVFVAMPQQAIVSADSGKPAAQVAVVSVPSAISTVASSTGGNATPPNAAQGSALAQQGEVKRDPRIDEYLFAHQRFSQPLNSAQYTRSAAFSVDTNK